MKRTAEPRMKLLLILLSTNVLTAMWTASVKANQKFNTTIDEEQYVFLKRICQVLTHLGVSQLGPLWVCHF